MDTVTLPTIRQYYEIYALNFILEFPELCVEDIKKHLINKNAKAQFSISIIFVNFTLLSHSQIRFLNRLSGTTLPNTQKASTQSIGSLTTSLTCPPTPHISERSRNSSQRDSFKAKVKFPKNSLFKNPIEQIRESHIIMKEFYSYFLAISDRLGMLSKFETLIAGFKSILENFNLETLISTPFDEYGEVIHESVVEHLRDECVKMINKLRVVRYNSIDLVLR